MRTVNDPLAWKVCHRRFVFVFWLCCCVGVGGGGRGVHLKVRGIADKLPRTQPVSPEFRFRALRLRVQGITFNRLEVNKEGRREV